MLGNRREAGTGSVMSDILKTGSTGEPVRALQSNLNRLGFSNRVDGVFGLAPACALSVSIFWRAAAVSSID